MGRVDKEGRVGKDGRLYGVMVARGPTEPLVGVRIPVESLFACASMYSIGVEAHLQM